MLSNSRDKGLKRNRGEKEEEEGARKARRRRRRRRRGRRRRRRRRRRQGRRSRRGKSVPMTWRAISARSYQVSNQLLLAGDVTLQLPKLPLQHLFLHPVLPQARA